jgi:glycosyltransferase involved in cell wall biosynthesis
LIFVRFGIVTSHPIQYQAPLFRALAERVDLHVCFAHRATADDQSEAEFGVPFQWDVDLTSGFSNNFLANVSSRPGITRFEGCDTPDVGEQIASRHFDATLVYGWHLKTYIQTAQSCRKLGVPVIARTDSYLHTLRPLPLRIAKAAYYPVFLRRFDYFAPTGHHAVDYLTHYYVPPRKMKVVPYCIDVEWFTKSARAARQVRARVRAEWGVTNGDTALLFSGKLVPRKRPTDLLNACRLLGNRGIAATAIFVGAGPLERELREYAAVKNIPAKFLGFKNQSQMPECYSAADILVLPSAVDTWGLVVNEAFACGLPAIVSDKVGCAPDMIREDLTGRVFPMGDSQRLAGAIEGLLGKVHDRAVIQALAEMTEKYSPQRSAEALIAAAEESLGGTRARGSWKGRCR